METNENQWLVAEHQRRNGTTLDAAALFADHRKQVTQLMVDAVLADQPQRACILGPGNCNDVDLNRLLSLFKHLHLQLVDLDPQATTWAVEKQVAPADRARIEVAPSVDLSGAVGYLQTHCGPASTSEARQAFDVNKLKSLLAEPVAIAGAHSDCDPLNGELFDCVLSSCLLSQMIDSLVLAIGPQHPSLVELVLTLRRQHLRTLVQALVPGGRGVLVTDFVSSQTLPNLMRIPESQLNGALFEAIAAKNFFTGLNPFAIQAELKSESLADEVTDVWLVPPWRWDIGVKQFAVAAILFKRRS